MTRLRRCCLLVVLLVAAGCVRQEPDAEPDRADARDTEAPDSLAFDGGGERPDTIRLGMVRGESYVPSEVSPSDQAAVIISDLLYDGLTEAEAGGETLTPALALAWSANDEFTEWTFELDDARITADAVVSHFDELLTGASTWPQAVLLADVAAVEPEGDAVVIFTLHSPNAGFPWLLSGLGASVVGPADEPTGRYEVTSDDANGLLLVASGSGANVEDLPEVVVSWADSPDDAYDDLTLGVIDGAVVPAGVLDDAASRFGSTPPPRAISRFYAMNVSPESILADDDLRRAVSAAIDRDAVVETSMAAEGVAVDGVVAPSLAGYRESTCGAPCAHDPELAATALDEIGDTIELTVAFTGDRQFPVANAMVRDLREVGFEAEAIEYEADELADAISRGEADLYSFGWIAPAASVDAVVPALFGARSSSNGLGNPSDEVGALINQALASEDDGARWALLADAQDQAVKEGRLIPLAVATGRFVAAPQLDFVGIRADGSLDLSADE